MTNEQLVVRIKARDNETENMLQLWQQCRRFIYGIAKHYQGCADIEDLEQEGYLALYDAVNGFDIYKGYKFLTYAERWIRRAMVRYIQNSGTVRIPERKQDKLQEYKKLVNLYHVNLGRNPSRHEIAFNMGISVEEVDDIENMACMWQIESLDSYLSEEDSVTIGDMVPCDVNVEADVLENVQQEQLKKVLWSLVDDLPDNQGHVLRHRYQKGRTYKAISEEVGSNIERVRIEYDALRSLRCSRKSRLLKPFLNYDQIYSQGISGTSVSKFNATWTSATERVAINSVLGHS